MSSILTVRTLPCHLGAFWGIRGLLTATHPTHWRNAEAVCSVSGAGVFVYITPAI